MAEGTSFPGRRRQQQRQRQRHNLHHRQSQPPSLPLSSSSVVAFLLYLAVSSTEPAHTAEALTSTAGESTAVLQQQKLQPPVTAAAEQQGDASEDLSTSLVLENQDEDQSGSAASRAQDDEEEQQGSEGNATMRIPRYSKGDEVPLYITQAGCSNDRKEHNFMDLPFCWPSSGLDKSKAKWDVALHNSSSMEIRAPFVANFQNDTDFKTVCERTLSVAEVQKLREAVKNKCFLLINVDGTRVGRALYWGFTEQGRHSLFTQFIFNFHYSSDWVYFFDIVLGGEVDITADEEVTVQFLYTTTWRDRKQDTYEPLPKIYVQTEQSSFPLLQFLEHPFFKYVTALASLLAPVLVRCATVLLLMGWLASILLSSLRQQRRRRSDSRQQEEDHFLQDVFAPPCQRELLCAGFGNGMQLLILSVAGLVLTLPLGGSLEGALNHIWSPTVVMAIAMIVAVSAAISGCTSSILYRQMDGTHWVLMMMLTWLLFMGPFIAAWAALSAVAYISGASLRMDSLVAMTFQPLKSYARDYGWENYHGREVVVLDSAAHRSLGAQDGDWTGQSGDQGALSPNVYLPHDKGTTFSMSDGNNFPVLAATLVFILVQVAALILGTIVGARIRFAVANPLSGNASMATTLVRKRKSTSTWDCSTLTQVAVAGFMSSAVVSAIIWEVIGRGHVDPYSINFYVDNGSVPPTNAIVLLVALAALVAATASIARTITLVNFAGEDHDWWRPVLCGSCTGLYVFMISVMFIIQWLNNSQQNIIIRSFDSSLEPTESSSSNDQTQLWVFITLSAMLSYALSLILGAVSYVASFAVMRHIFFSMSHREREKLFPQLEGNEQQLV